MKSKFANWIVFQFNIQFLRHPEQFVKVNSHPDSLLFKNKYFKFLYDVSDDIYNKARNINQNGL